MLSMKRAFKIFIFLLSLFFILGLIFNLSTEAQNWVPIPPYNILWPLWSPVLSPPDPITGVPAPLVTSLDSSTVLPVQPVLVWSPSNNYPWLLYNTPVGLAYFDLLHGVDLWPPANLIDICSDPNLCCNTLPPTDPEWLQEKILFANSYFKHVYRSLLERENVPLYLINNVDIFPFLTPAEILGL